MEVKNYRKLFNNSFQRAIVPDSSRFYTRFYQLLIATDPQIEKLFATTDMDRQIKMLMQSMTYVMSFSATLKPGSEMRKIAKMHGKGKLGLPAKYYDIWLDCMIVAVREFDPKFDKYIETAWRVMMAPGIAYMKSFCDK
ncbi:MAG: globin [Gammaproteobacteria bacterium]